MRGRKGPLEVSDSALTELPPPPDWFTEEAAREWLRTGPDMVERRLLAAEAIATFEAYCCAVSDFQRAAKHIAVDGELITDAKGRKTRHPAYQTKFQALTEMRRLAAELGMTPAARAKGGASPAQAELWDASLLPR